MDGSYPGTLVIKCVYILRVIGGFLQKCWFIPQYSRQMVRNTINDEHVEEMVYDDDNKYELLNKYFSLVSKLGEENIPVPPFWK